MKLTIKLKEQNIIDDNNIEIPYDIISCNGKKCGHGTIKAYYNGSTWSTKKEY